ncbi:F0F1 ATP synthase subunit delta [Tessaracoccus oleiagri]|uniref:ATP synthase subunit delta n=1 Tax=Tessaracoccus oleiagri TaxID=686624 RepID=A0A1G9LZR8_9ACTN|nr:F0F1 ATP synthase subunit delta [Tessaracoccus oleiagri]SDL67446.1 F-type H+-transporting ATPase subunit delta [Tessaracoccus oleiagri]
MTMLDAANELFAVSDVLAGQPMLRRSLSDPSARPEQRLELARRLFGSRIGPEAMSVLERVVGSPSSSPVELRRGLEREGVVAALQSARDEGSLERVTTELHGIGSAAAGSAELTTTLRSAAYELDAKRGLVDRLLGERAHPVTRLLASRAVQGHRRTFSATVEDYLETAAELADVVVAKVTVARPLDQGRLDRLRNALSAQVGRPVTLQVDIDPSVIGGIDVAIGHDVYESTVAGRLDDVRRQLINS